MNTALTRILVALPAEARPVVRHYALRCLVEEPIRVYGSNELLLYVTGVGRAAMASAVGYAFAHGGSHRDALWINLGIAGHRDLNIGTPRLAHKIVEKSSGKSWYPPITFDRPCPGATLQTVDKPETEYPDDKLYDMEASAFISAAQRFATAELIQVVKVVSDNSLRSADKLPTKSEVHESISRGLPIVDDIVRALQPAAAHRSELGRDPHAYSTLLERVHFTKTQSRELRGLLRRWQLLHPESDTLQEFARFTTAGELLGRLRHELEVRR